MKRQYQDQVNADQITTGTLDGLRLTADVIAVGTLGEFQLSVGRLSAAVSPMTTVEEWAELTQSPGISHC
ncbi:hypothetical protein [Cupriavidus nantongensis]|uniref:Uncharacterized protein n=1 Tax=Cupriavidus nantongensis TaxID=1796606 RepID=A0A142JHV5_9BURK|nr:hypothetical protein [Cupriavidus nantongensis]AMR77667.1 hypothetical protein A2G96_07925 [Cupriavidus nantongensis]